MQINNMINLKDILRHVQNFPKDGIDFVDITPVLKDADAFKYAIDCFISEIKDIDFDFIVGSESRGFILGTPIAYALNKGFIPIRKRGKLPYKTISVEYELEYGADILEMHIDAVEPGQKVVIIDDLLATGGTVDSNIKLIEKLGGTVQKLAFLVELMDLGARKRLSNYEICSLIKI